MGGPHAHVELVADTRRVLLTQGGYYVATGVLPFVSRRLFSSITGPKHDWWLVHAVGALVTVVGGALIAGAMRRDVSPELVGIGAGSAATLAAIDIFYVAKGRIAPTYLIDAGAELGVLGALALSIRRSPNRHLAKKG